jgi:Endo-alpha-N-acetylgalactosaminidase N-terminal
MFEYEFSLCSKTNKSAIIISMQMRYPVGDMFLVIQTNRIFVGYDENNWRWNMDVEKQQNSNTYNRVSSPLSSSLVT